MRINACWEIKDFTPCRWMIVWKILEDGIMSGAVAGYSGGGSFQLEPFMGRVDEDRLTVLVIDGEDCLTGEESEFEDFGKEAIRASEDAVDTILRYNIKSVWENSEQLFLNPSVMDELESNSTFLVKSTGFTPWIPEVCKRVGLTSCPSK